MEIRSPVLTSMSYSRGGCTLLTEFARWISSSVVLPMALTTATTSDPWRRDRAMWSATARMRSASPTEVPPNFWTTRGIGQEATYSGSIGYSGSTGCSGSTVDSGSAGYSGSTVDSGSAGHSGSTDDPDERRLAPEHRRDHGRVQGSIPGPR